MIIIIWRIKRGNEINLSRIKVREKERLDQIDKERRAKLREQWQEEKKYLLKMSVKEGLVNNINNTNNENIIDQANEKQNENDFVKNNGGLTL